MGILRGKNKGEAAAPSCAVQTGSVWSRPFASLNGYVPMSAGGNIYTALRDGIPIVDAAINKIVRLTGGFSFDTGNDLLNNNVNTFFGNINVGGNMKGIGSFIDCYLEQLLTYGSAVGEMIIANDKICALYNGELDVLEVKRSKNGLDPIFYNGNKAVEYPERLLFSVLNPKPGQILGTGLLQGLPFVGKILLNIYDTIGQNWEHAGNIRYAVTYKPQKDSSDRAYSSDRAKQIATSWKDAMDASTVKDFVAVGDVDVKVIGADNKVLDSEIPVRQMLEEIVAKTGLPPFMLGLNWSTSERMSKQQTDILTTELEHYRRILTPVLEKIGRTYLDSIGVWKDISVKWDDITLQDEEANARAKLYYAQAQKIETESEN